ncbi:MAG: hypothetical protein JWP37_4208 [Mucilaginibacter sp.]|nr:hypothetical protein [Mucilaginibacter sp.]
MIGYKKQRGLKRYYKNLTIKIDLDEIDKLDFDSPQPWFESQHLHFDWKGHGNNSFKGRKPHLDKLFRHFDILIKKTKNLKTNFQLYVILLDYHSSSDALFMHAPNPDNDQFPFKISDLQLTTTLTNNPLNEYIDHLAGYEKRYGQAGEAFCLIFKENVGQPFGKG